MTDTPSFVIVDDYEPVARAALPQDVWDYFAGGASDEWTLAECSDPEGSLELPSVGCVLSPPAVYHKVDLPPPTPGKRRRPR